MRRFTLLLLDFVCCVALFCLPAQAQQSAPATSSDRLAEVVLELRNEVHELHESVTLLREECQSYRRETAALREELAGKGAAQAETPATSEQQLSKLGEDLQLLEQKVNEQHQAKVESASRYRVRLSGIALFNLFSNRGTVDSIDVPAFAFAPTLPGSSGSFGGTLKQSLIALEAFGPDLAGARTSANIQFDFAGGFSQTSNGYVLSIPRLRTGIVRLAWTKTAIVAGQDALFFAPESPTSFASLSQPALAYSGNLWAWTPQLRVERRFDFSDNSSLLLQAGILDALSGEPPATLYLRQPVSGESSGQPAYAVHAGYSGRVSRREIRLGAGAYYSRQNWGYDRNQDAWAGILDWRLSLSREFQLSGEFYRGKAVGGLGAAQGLSVLYTGNPALSATEAHPINSEGGWAQLKYSPMPRLELNGAFGEDSPFASDLRYVPGAMAYSGPLVVRNQTVMANAIFRPRSDIVLSLEYRHLRSFQLPAQSQQAEHVNAAVGVLF